MKNDIRSSGIEIVGNIPWGMYFSQFYQTKEDLIEVVIPYFKAGLENNELCIWIVPEFLGIEEIKESLKITIPNFNIYLEKGQVEIIDYANWYFKEGVFDSQKILGSLTKKVNQALANGYDGLRLTEDALWQNDTLDDFIDYDERLNSIINEYPMIALCTYSLKMCSSIDTAEIAVKHDFSLGKKKGKWTRIESTNYRSKEKIVDINSQESKKAEQSLGQVEEPLYTSEEKNRETFNFMREAIQICELVFDEKGRPVDNIILDVNPAYEQNSGLKREQVIGRRVKEFLPIVEQVWLDNYAEVVRTGRKLYFEEYSAALNMWFEVFASPLDSNRFIAVFSNITKRKQTEETLHRVSKEIQAKSEKLEEALRISEEKYRSLFNSIDEGFNIIEMIFDNSGKAVDHRILEANSLQEKMTGLKDVVGKRARELLPNFEDYWIESFGQVAITGEPVRLEKRIEELDRWFDVYASRFGGEGSRKVAVVFNDITLRKRAEEALHQSEKRLNFALETIHTGAWDLDLVNHDSPHRSLEHDRIFGYEQLLPKWTYEMFLNHVLPEDRAMVDEKFQKAVTSGGDWSFECRIRRVDGVIRWIWAAGRHQVDSTGSIRWMAGIVQDITERKRVEKALLESEAHVKVVEAVEAERQRFFNMLEALPVMVCLLTPDYHVAFANRTFREKFGESEGRHCYEYCFGLTEPCDFCEAYKVLETGQLHHWEVTTPEGSVIDAYDLPFTDADGSPMVLEMDIDITEHRKAIETLAKFDEIQIKEIHHRVKNNLQVISSLLDLQAETFSRLKVCKIPQVMEAFMESQNRVASMALIHEELYKGKESENLDFASYLRKLTANLLNSYNPQNNGLNLKLNLEEIYLDMDTAIPLGIIVNELVSNSFKHAFSKRNTREITIALQKMKNFTANRESFELDNSCKENFCYVLRVADNGKGIPKEVDLQTVNSLGLKLVNILVDQIDGCLELKRDRGTEFTIWFNNIEK